MEKQPEIKKKSNDGIDSSSLNDNSSSITTIESVKRQQTISQGNPVVNPFRDLDEDEVS